MISNDKILDLWAEAQKMTGVQNPRSFADLKAFADLVETEKCVELAELLRRYVMVDKNVGQTNNYLHVDAVKKLTQIGVLK